MKLHLKYLLPGPLELIGLAFIDILLIILGNSRQLLNYYGLNSSSQLIGQSAGKTVENSLAKIDNLHFTDALVTFSIWALVGLLCFNIITGIVRIYRDIEFDEELSSNKYVHPRTFRRAAFWSQIALDIIEAVVCLLVFVASLAVLFMVIMPIVFSYSRMFLFGVSPRHLGDLLIGFVGLYAGLVMSNICARLVMQRHKLLEN